MNAADHHQGPGAWCRFDRGALVRTRHDRRCGDTLDRESFSRLMMRPRTPLTSSPGRSTVTESWMQRLRTSARATKRDVLALYLAARDARVPWYAKVLAVATAAYALSPLDLIPDFIPVLGYLDDLIIVPLGIMLAVRLIPAPIMADLRRHAEEQLSTLPPTSRVAAVVVVAIWILVGIFVVHQFLT